MMHPVGGNVIKVPPGGTIRFDLDRLVAILKSGSSGYVL
jgi:hypothetical protein